MSNSRVEDEAAVLFIINNQKLCQYLTYTSRTDVVVPEQRHLCAAFRRCQQCAIIITWLVACNAI